MTEVKFWRAIFTLLCLALIIFFVIHAWSVLVPFLLGVVIAYLIYPLVDRFVALGFRQDRVVFILYVFLMGLAVTLGSWLFPALYKEATVAIDRMPEYSVKMNAIVNSLTVQIQGYLVPFVGSRAESFSIPFDASNFLEQMFYTLPSNLLNVAHIGMWIFILPFVSFFVLAQGGRWIDDLFNLTPSEYVESLLGLIAEINASLGGYVRGTLLDAMCVGFLTMFGLLIIGVDGAILLGFVTGLLNIVPFLAPVVGGALALFTGYFQGLNMAHLLAILGLYIGVRMVDDFVFIPFVLGSSVQLHPIAMLFAVLAGIELGGFLGLVFAIPVAVVIKVFIMLFIRKKRESHIHQQNHIYS